LDSKIALCFHSHNNLQLSFSNAQCLIKNSNNREVIIDSTVFGMGRGAGNLCTELLTQYINDNHDERYNIIPILKVIDEQINPIFAKTPWGYSVPYYLAATNNCHPNYAKYLVDKQTLPVEMINFLLRMIPVPKRSMYDVDLIKQIYLDTISETFSDAENVEKIRDLLINQRILLLAPGKSLINEKEKIEAHIKKYNPFIISLNFIPDNFDSDIAFFTNIKRFSLVEDFKKPLILSSNIEDKGNTGALFVNYSSYINDSAEFDNTFLMLLKLLTKIGIKKICVAGLDGFSDNPSENYSSELFFNATNYNDLGARNKTIEQQIRSFEKNIDIEFITKSLFDSQVQVLGIH
jgi:4-hydroxy 2-oxovalerate aldolase